MRRKLKNHFIRFERKTTKQAHCTFHQLTERKVVEDLAMRGNQQLHGITELESFSYRWAGSTVPRQAYINGKEKARKNRKSYVI